MNFSRSNKKIPDFQYFKSCRHPTESKVYVEFFYKTCHHINMCCRHVLEQYNHMWTWCSLELPVSAIVMYTVHKLVINVHYALYNIDSMQVLLHINYFLVMFQFLLSERFPQSLLLLASFLENSRK